MADNRDQRVTGNKFANFSNSASQALGGRNAQLVFAALINKLKLAKDKIQFFRDLQANYPLVWEALERVANSKELLIGENLNFIIQTKDLASNGIFETIYNKFFSPDVIEPNVNSEERTQFLNSYKTDTVKAKEAVETMLNDISQMLIQNIIQKPIIETKFREVFPKVLEEHKESSKTAKKKH